MMKIIWSDFLGNELYVGDVVVFCHAGYSGFVSGTLISGGSSLGIVSFIDDQGKEVTASKNFKDLILSQPFPGVAVSESFIREVFRDFDAVMDESDPGSSPLEEGLLILAAFLGQGCISCSVDIVIGPKVVELVKAGLTDRYIKRLVELRWHIDPVLDRICRFVPKSM